MKYLITILFLLTLNPTFGQTVYEPQILILAPNLIKYEKFFDQDILNQNEYIKKNTDLARQDEVFNSAEFKKKPENLQITLKSQIEFLKNLDFFKTASFISANFLTYRFFEKFPNLLIKLKDVRSDGTLNDLKVHSEKEKLQYVLNFSSIELYTENKISYAKITVQLYDNVTNAIFLNKSYIGDWHNPGFEFTCENKTISCTINNALSEALQEVVYTIASNSPTLKREKQLRQERAEVLMKNYLNQPFDSQLLKNIISPLDSNINVNKAYQALFSNDKSKFVAFFLDLSDQGFAYIVKGVKYKNKWYYEKSIITYFEAENLQDDKQRTFNNLQEWNFFKENSTEFNPDFWETKLFEKIRDLKQDPEWKEYGESIWKTEERDNRPYIGLYKIVASQLKIEIEEYNNKKEKEIVDKYFIPLADKLKAQNNYETVLLKYNAADFILVYPTDMKAILCPIKVQEKGKDMFIRYFVLLPSNKIYEWTYLNINDLKTSKIDFMEQINTLTEWDFSFDTLDNAKFWDEYVLLKSGNTYKYLKEVK